MILGNSGRSRLRTTEVVDVNSVSSTSPWNHAPFGDLPSFRGDAAGGLLGSIPILCGGFSPVTNGFTLRQTVEDSCISYKDSQWTRTHKMTTKRAYLNSVQLNSTTLWIIGGTNGHADSSGYRALDSTEFIRSDLSVGIQGPELPFKGYKNFCTVKYSEQQVYIIGGCDAYRELDNKVYIFNPMDGFTHSKGPALKNERCRHACGLMSNGKKSKIVVAGGSTGYGHTISSVEFFDSTVNNWIPGKKIQRKINQMKHKIQAS